MRCRCKIVCMETKQTGAQPWTVRHATQTKLRQLAVLRVIHSENLAVQVSILKTIIRC